MSSLSLLKKIFWRAGDREEKKHPEKAKPPVKKKLSKKDTDKAAFKAVGDTKKTKKATSRPSIVAGRIDLNVLMSEKSVDQQAKDIVVFRVDPSATKGQIAQAVREKYGTDVLGVRVATFRPKARRRGRTRGSTTFWKKAYVKVSDVSAVSTGP